MIFNEAQQAKRAEARREARERFDREYGGGEASSPDSKGEPSPGDTFGIEERCRSKWASSPALRAEFTSLEAYTAFKRAEARGAVRIISRKP